MRRPEGAAIRWADAEREQAQRGRRLAEGAVAVRRAAGCGTGAKSGAAPGAGRPVGGAVQPAACPGARRRASPGGGAPSPPAEPAPRRQEALPIRRPAGAAISRRTAGLAIATLMGARLRGRIRWRQTIG